MEELKGKFNLEEVLSNLYKAQLANKAYIFAIVSLIKFLDQPDVDLSQLKKGTIYEAFQQSLDSALQFASDHDPILNEALSQMIKRDLKDIPGFHFDDVPES